MENIGEVMSILFSPLYIDVSLWGFTFCYMDIFVFLSLFGVVVMFIRKVL